MKKMYKAFIYLNMEKNMHSMSVGNFCKLLSALGYELDIVKKEGENE